jgi:hypothetical protein
VIVDESAQIEKAPEPLWVRGPFASLIESSVGRRTGPNKEPKRDPDDDDTRGANIRARRVILGRVDGQHVREQRLLSDPPGVKVVLPVLAREPTSGKTLTRRASVGRFGL